MRLATPATSHSGSFPASNRAMLKHFVIFVAGGIFLLPPVRAEENLQQTVKELRDQVRLLTERMQALETKLAEKERSDTPKQSGAAKKEMSAAIAAVPEPPKIAAKPVEAGAIKGSFKLPGTDTSLALGGYAKLDAIYNSQSTGGSGGSNQGDQWLLPSSIPVDDSQSEANQITFHARQSRFWLKSYTPTRLGDLNTYLEMDFFAFQSPGDERVSNSYTPRMRHAFGQLGNFLAGQTWTTFMDAQALPELNDFGGPVGRIFVRQPQIRWTQPFTIGAQPFEWAVAVESPETTLTDTQGNRVTPDDDRYPDAVARISMSRSWGGVMMAAMGRQIRSDMQNQDSVLGGALNVSGKINTFGRDDARFMLAYGNALGRYSSSNLFNDAAIDASGKIHLFDAYSGYFAYRHWWNPEWRSTLAYGFAYGENTGFVPSTVSKWAQSVQVNLLWSPLLQTTFGLEYTYAMRALESGASGDLHRVQFSTLFQF